MAGITTITLSHAASSILPQQPQHNHAHESSAGNSGNQPAAPERIAQISQALAERATQELDRNDKKRGVQVPHRPEASYASEEEKERGEEASEELKNADDNAGERKLPRISLVA